MGSDKALLSYHHQTLLARTQQVAQAVARKTYIVGPRERYAAYGDVIEDIYPDCGPLGGIHAALNATSTELNLVLSVDMPLMTSEFLSWLLQQSNDSDALIVVPDALGGLQPLCAVYRRQVAGGAVQPAGAGDFRLQRLRDVLGWRSDGGHWR